MAEQQQDPSFWDSAGDLFLGFAGAYGNAYLTSEFGDAARGAAVEPSNQPAAPTSGPVTSQQPAQAGIGNSPLAWLAVGALAIYLVTKNAG